MTTTTPAPLSTLRIGRRAFAVETASSDADLGRPVYAITGLRGARYLTSRNVHQPEVMFLVHAPGGRGFGIPSGYEALRLTDRSGALEVL